MLLDAVIDYAIYMLDPDGYITSWNTGAERIKGYPASEALGMSFSKFFTPQDQASGKPLFGLNIAKRTGRYAEEGWRVRKDGTTFWAMTVLDAIHDPEGKVIGFAKVTRDISERRAGEQALRDSESRFRMLVDSVCDYAIFMLDTNGVITNWNKGAERIKGYTAAEAIGQHFSMFYTAEDQEAELPKRALARALDEGRFQGEGIRVRKDGTAFWANVVIQPIRDQEGRLIGFAKVTRDITEQKKAEAALEAAREELHQAQKMEALGHLTGGVAHDFNNFLTAIRGNLELLKSGSALPESAQQSLDAALQATQNAATVVRQMMVFARRQPMQLDRVEVNRVVEEIVGLINRSAHENIVVELNLAEGLPPAKCDPVQLQTGVLNLALNAVDAMPDGGVLSIKTELCEYARHDRLQPGTYVAISVTDTGAGMSPEVLAHAFEPFFTTKELGKGTGLGLSMVYGAVQQLGGDASIESKLGQGTTVKLILPAGSPDDVQPEASVDGNASQDELAPLPDRPLNILYVEDDFLVGLATIDILEKAGLGVQSAAGGEDALVLLDQHPDIDLLLTDIGLPGMNGHELVAEARRRRGGLKVLFLTGYDRTGPVVGTEADEITTYMDKPYDPKTLLDTIHRLAAVRR